MPGEATLPERSAANAVVVRMRGIAVPCSLFVVCGSTCVHLVSAYQGGKMQRVVRSTLVGLLTVAGLTACGDKITVPPQTTTPVGTVVHSVTLSPASVTVA